MLNVISRYGLRLVWKIWYPLLTRLTHGASLDFLNYGYAPRATEDNPLPLDPADEPNRPCIQLYHKVAAAVDLAGRRVLEISCGHGGGASFVARYHQPTAVHGIDRNPQAVARCRRRHDDARLHFTPGDALFLKFADASFDAVLNVEASHCYADLPRFLSEVSRVLRPGGCLLYADFRTTETGLPAVHAAVRGSGLSTVRFEDLSAGVVRGMRLNTDRYLELIRSLVPGLLRPAATAFAGVPGSPIYRELESGMTTYFLYVLAKA